MNRKKTLIQKRTALLKKIEKCGDFIKGSVTRITKAGKATGAYNLTYKDKNQKTCTQYVPERHFKKIGNSISNMAKVRRLLDEISKLNLEILKMD